MPAELPLVPSAMALALSALLLFHPRGGGVSHAFGVALVAIGSALPVALHPFIDPARSGGRALWEWSAVGGPIVQASYRLDDLAAVAIALVVAFTGASLALKKQEASSHALQVTRTGGLLQRQSR